MKKTTFIFSAVCLLLVSISCKKDDDDSNPLIGSWTEFQFDIEDGSFVDVEGCNLQNTFTFNENNTYEYVDYDSATEGSDECVVSSNDSESGTWEIIGDKRLSIVTEGESETFTETADYNIEGNKLTVTYSYEFEGSTETETYIYIRKQ